MKKIGVLFASLMFVCSGAYSGVEEQDNVTVEEIFTYAEGTCGGDVRVILSDNSFGAYCDGAYLDISDTSTSAESKIFSSILTAYSTGATVKVQVDDTAANKNSCMSTNICKIVLFRLK